MVLKCCGGDACVSGWRWPAKKPRQGSRTEYILFATAEMQVVLAMDSNEFIECNWWLIDVHWM